MKIKELRETGHSIPEISRECNISKSTALRYAKNTKIKPQYKERWLMRRNASKIISEKNWESAKIKAEKALDSLENKDLALLISALYWAEGAKKDFSFLNSDSRMIKVFIYVLRKVFSIKNTDIKISIRTYEDLNKNKCLMYWSKVTGVELDKNTSIEVIKGKKSGKLEFGMCRIRVRRGGLLLKEFFATIERVISLIGKEKPS